jgi:hypothetical protein
MRELVIDMDCQRCQRVAHGHVMEPEVTPYGVQPLAEWRREVHGSWADHPRATIEVIRLAIIDPAFAKLHNDPDGFMADVVRAVLAETAA